MKQIKLWLTLAMLMFPAHGSIAEGTILEEIIDSGGEILKAPTDKDYNGLIKHADRLYKKKKIVESHQYYGMALALNSKRPDAFFGIARVESRLKQYDLALALLSKVIDIDPTYKDVYSFRGYTYTKLGKYDLAEADFRQALKLNPKSYKTYNAMGITASIQKKYPLAMQYYSKVIEIKPDYHRAYNNRSVVYSRIGKYDLALRDLNKVLELKSDSIKAIINRAKVRIKQQKYKLAVDELKDALPENSHYLHQQLAWVYAVAKDEKFADSKKAIKYGIQACEKRNYNWVACLDTIAAAYARDGQFEKAVVYQEKAIKRTPPTSWTLVEHRKRLDYYRRGKAWVE